VVGHLISAELEGWIPRVQIILEHGPDQPFTSFDRFAHVERDREATLPDLIDRFAELRAESLRRLSALVTDGDMDRAGRHPALGEVTLRQLLATWAVHDLDHLAQAYAGLAGSHDQAVGPWKAYLGILLRRDDPSAQPD
jgi:DinB family protein